MMKLEPCSEASTPNKLRASIVTWVASAAVMLLTAVGSASAQTCMPGESTVAFPVGEISYITVPADLPALRIIAAGGVGGESSRGDSGGAPGLGAVVSGTAELFGPQMLAVLVATAGWAATPNDITLCGGGGGGSFIGLGSDLEAFAQSNLLIAAGGGGGACNNTGFGGAGGTPNGSDGGHSVSNPNPARGGGADGSGGAPNVDSGGTGGGAATGDDGAHGQGAGHAGGGGGGAGGNGGDGAAGSPPARGGQAAINGGAGGNPRCNFSGDCGGVGGFGGGGGGASNGAGGGGGYAGGGGTFGVSFGGGGGSSFAAPSVTDTAMSAVNNGDGSVLFCTPSDVHTVSVDVTEGLGTTSPAVQLVVDNTDAVFTVTSEAGWQVASVNGDACTPSDQGDGTWVAENVTENCHVEITFTPFVIEYIVSMLVSGNGMVSPVEQAVPPGGIAEFMITPDEGWHLESINGDSCTPGDQGDGIWVVESLTEDCQLAVEFQLSSTGEQGVVALPVMTLPGFAILTLLMLALGGLALRGQVTALKI